MNDDEDLRDARRRATAGDLDGARRLVEVLEARADGRLPPPVRPGSLADAAASTADIMLSNGEFTDAEFREWRVDPDAHRKPHLRFEDQMRGTCAAAIELAAEDHLEFILESWFGPGTGSSDRVAAWRALGAFRRFFSGLLYESLYAEVRRLLQDDDFVREAAPHLIGG